MKTHEEIIQEFINFALRKCQTDDTRPSDTFISVKECIDTLKNMIKLNN